MLPFTNPGSDPGTEYLSEGITEGLINSLSQLPAVKVRSRNSVFHYKGRDAIPQKVGRELGVRAVLTGRVEKLGDDLSVSVELIDTQDDSHIWGERYTRKLSDLVGLQEELSRDIAGNLRLRLSGAEQRNWSRTMPLIPKPINSTCKVVTTGTREARTVCSKASSISTAPWRKIRNTRPLIPVWPTATGC